MIKNELSHNSGDVEVFDTFMELALRFASLDMEYNARKKYLGEADMALTLFSESVEISDVTIIEKIKNYSDRLAKMAEVIQDAEEEEILSNCKERQEQNTQEFEKLSVIYRKMEEVETQDEFDEMLKEISEIEGKIDKRAFDSSQKESYETITQGFSRLISEKMEDLNYQRVLEENKEAIKSFKLVFDKYSEKKSFYNKNEADLKALVTKHLFAYDSRNLLNETLIYFNHVYSTIFNGVGDDLKYKLTEWSVTSEKIRKRN